MNVSFFQGLLNTIGAHGRLLLERSRSEPVSVQGVWELATALVSGRGEASGVAIARELLSAYRRLDREQKLEFFRYLLTDLAPRPEAVTAAAEDYLAAPSQASMDALARAIESPRQEFFRRLNLAPGATAEILDLRNDILDLLDEAPELAPVDADIAHLLSSWFNRGFLVLKRIDWSTPASILERIIQYEAVHEIQGWDDLRRRLDPRDRRCFGFFHPALADDPLIFVEVALTHRIPGSIQELLTAEPKDEDGVQPRTAVFYSISNCQVGLRGISFGNFLIKQVVEDLAKEMPSLRSFVTLSPMPRFADWLKRTAAAGEEGPIPKDRAELLEWLDEPSWAAHAERQERLQEVLLPLAAYYFLEAKNWNDRPLDAVARFHLGNGARLERINWLGDKSAKGLRQSHGLMVNYLYDLKDIEKNHEAYMNDGAIVASRGVRQLLKSTEKIVSRGAKAVAPTPGE